MASRTCERKRCPNSLDGLRVDARYCSDACAREGRRERKRGEARGKVWIRGHWRQKPAKTRQDAA